MDVPDTGRGALRRPFRRAVDTRVPTGADSEAEGGGDEEHDDVLGREEG